MGRNSTVVLALSVGLTVWDRIPVDSRISEPVQTGPATHLAFYTLILFYSLGINWMERGFNYPPLTKAEVKERVELYIYYPSVYNRL
jgi:hypothetical protein